MSEEGMYEVRAYVTGDDGMAVRENPDDWKAQDETHARALARLLSRVSEYAWVEVWYMGGNPDQRIRVYVKGHCVLSA